MMKTTIHALSLFSFILFTSVLAMGQVGISKVEITHKILENTSKKLRLELTILNTGDHPVYVATDPVQIDSTKGYYISIAENNAQSIVVSSRVYPPLVYSPYSNQTRVALKKLIPNKILTVRVALPFAIVETIPPVDLPLDLRKTSLRHLRSIKFELGFFREEAGLTELLMGKSFVKGHEEMVTGNMSGKRLFEIQELVSTDIDLYDPIQNTKRRSSQKSVKN